MTRAPTLMNLTDGCELGFRQPMSLRDRRAHSVHQPERGGVQNEAHLVGGCAHA